MMSSRDYSDPYPLDEETISNPKVTPAINCRYGEFPEAADDVARELFEKGQVEFEYGCFSKFDVELVGLAAKYGTPGRFLVAVRCAEWGGKDIIEIAEAEPEPVAEKLNLLPGDGKVLTYVLRQIGQRHSDLLERQGGHG